MTKKAYLVLQNGQIFEGCRFGADGQPTGELVFTTGMAGYVETLSDPSYYGQIVLQTFPLIGNYGMIREDSESNGSVLKAYIVREWCDAPSNFRSGGTLDAFLKDANIPGLYGVDTRAVTRVIRDAGVMNACIVDTVASGTVKELSAYAIKDAVAAVSCKEKSVYPAKGKQRFRVAVLDCGVQYSILRALCERGCEVTLFPHSTTAEEILALAPDGLVLSNGPGNPEENHKQEIRPGFPRPGAALRPLVKRGEIVSARRDGVCSIRALLRFFVHENHHADPGFRPAGMGNVHSFDPRDIARRGKRGREHPGHGRAIRLPPRFLRVGDGHIHKGFFRRPFRRQKMHTAAPDLAERLGQRGIRLFLRHGPDKPGSDDFRRHGKPRLVKLNEKAFQKLGDIIQITVRPEIRAVVEQNAAAHKKNAQRKAPIHRSRAQNVHVLIHPQNNSLAFHRPLNSPNAVSQNGRLLELHGLGSGEHLSPQAVKQFAGFALEEKRDLPDQGCVSLFVHIQNARPETLPHMVIQTRPRAVGERPVRTAPERENLVNGLPCFASRPGRGKRAEQHLPGRSPSGPEPPDDLQTRIRGQGINPEQNVVLVIPENDIITRPVFFDQARFQQQGLLLRFSDKRF